MIKEVEVEVVKEIEVAVEKDKMHTSEFIHILNPKIDPVIAKEIGIAVDKYSIHYQIPKKLILSIINKESRFDPLAKSKVAKGLMQIYPKYHQDKMDELGITKDNLFHIDNNINFGCYIWRSYFDQSNKDLDETFHKYLSKNATKQEKNKYMGDILTTWAKLEFIEYKRTTKKINEGKEEERKGEEEEKQETGTETPDSASGQS